MPEGRATLPVIVEASEISKEVVVPEVVPEVVEEVWEVSEVVVSSARARPARMATSDSHLMVNGKAYVVCTGDVEMEREMFSA